MGNDGGDIPRRKELVKEKQKQQVANSEAVARGRARFCNLTNESLKEPLAICTLGHIYNYQQILSALVQKHLPEQFSYIKKLTDIKKVTVEKAPIQSDNCFICPITKLEYNGLNKFVALWKCGHVFSRKAFKEVQTEDKQKKCIICQIPYENKDLIDLNLEGAQLDLKRKEILLKQMMKKKAKEEEKAEQAMGEPKKRVKKQEMHISSLDRLGGQFRDVIRDRSKFRQLFSRQPN